MEVQPSSLKICHLDEVDVSEDLAFVTLKVWSYGQMGWGISYCKYIHNETWEHCKLNEVQKKSENRETFESKMITHGKGFLAF